MTSASGTFEVHEILNSSRTPDLNTPFPVFQADLYNVSQPGMNRIFLTKILCRHTKPQMYGLLKLYHYCVALSIV